MFDLTAAGLLREQLAQRDRQWPTESLQKPLHLAGEVQSCLLEARVAGLPLGAWGAREAGAPLRGVGVRHPAV